MFLLHSKAGCSRYPNDLDKTQSAALFKLKIKWDYRDQDVQNVLIQLASTYGGCLLMKKLIPEMNKVSGPPIMSIRIFPVLSSLLTAKRGPEIGRILVKTAALIFIFDPRDGRETLLEEIKVRGEKSEKTTADGNKFSPETTENILNVLFESKTSEEASVVKLMQLLSDKWKLLQMIKLALFGNRIKRLLSLPSDGQDSAAFLSTLPGNRKEALFMAVGDVIAKTLGGLREGKIIESIARNIRESINLRILLIRYCEGRSFKFEIPDLLEKSKKFLNQGMRHALRSISKMDMALMLKRLVTDSLEHPTVDQVYSKLQNMMNKSVEISAIPMDVRTVYQQSSEGTKNNLIGSRHVMIRQILPKVIKHFAQSWTESELGRLLSSTILEVLTSSHLETLTVLATKINVGIQSDLFSKLLQLAEPADGQSSFFEKIKTKLGSGSIDSIRENFIRYLEKTDTDSSPTGVVNLNEELASLAEKIVIVT
ncbi:hypothetical protein AAHC03_016669 [Spirometra sp. Aus1]